MMSNKSSIMKYLGSAIAVGGTVMLGSGLIGEHSSLKKKAKKTAGKAIDALDNIITGMQNIVG